MPCENSERVFEEAATAAKAANGRKVEILRESAKQNDRLKRRPFRDFSKAELQNIVHCWHLKAKGEALNDCRFSLSVSSSEELQDEIAALRGQLASLERRNGAYADLETNPVVRTLIEDAGGELEWPDRISFREKKFWFEAIVRECLISLKRYALAILETGTPPAVEFVPPEFVTVKHASVPASISLNELIERFEKAPNREDVKPKTRDEFKLVYRMMREVFGDSTPILDITKAQFTELQSLYKEVPARSSLLYPNKSLKEIVTLAQREGLRPMERATFNKRMRLLSSVFGFAEREGLLPINRAKGLTLRERKKAEGRQPFNVEQLNKIFSSSTFQNFANDREARFTPQHSLSPHEFWTPLIALFQGTRMEEALQLRLNDVEEIEGVNCLRIRASHVGQSLTGC